jgi:hypothetical protein
MSLLSKLLGRKPERPNATDVETEDPILIVPIPPLVDVLSHHEQQKGTPLTEAEVMEIAGGAICMTMRQSRAAAMADARGYADIDPANAWAEWQRLRSQR